MTRRGTMVGRALRVLGLVAVIVAVWMGGRWALLAAIGAAGMGFGLTINALLRFWSRQGGAVRPTDFTHVLDLLRRAVGARGAWATGLTTGPLEAPEGGDPTLPDEAWERGAALVEFAAADGRSHVSHEAEGTFVAVGDYPYAVGVLLASGEPEPVIDELRRVIAAIRAAELEATGGAGAAVARRLATMTAGAGTVESVARAGATFARELTERGTVIVLRGAERSRVVAVDGADPRLDGLVLHAEAPVVRAIEGGIPIVVTGEDDVFGPGSPERRRAERAGVALPLFDGRLAIGALVIVGRGIETSSEPLKRLAAELGPRLAAVRALQAAEQRATTDVLTGLPNRAMFERRMRGVKGNGAAEPATLVYFDLDHFKKLNDTHGHPAGDAALRHLAGIFASHVRGRDLVARMGGEEFAVWLPGTPLSEGLAVAERIRGSVESRLWKWSGEVWPLTVSCGVAAMPEHAQDAGKLLGLADQALYRAKASGRNRVEKAGVGH